MLLTQEQRRMIYAYRKGMLSEEDRQTVEEWEKASVAVCGLHLPPMPLTSEQEALLEQCRQRNLTAEEKKQVLQLHQQSIDYCEENLLSPAMREYCFSED